MKYKLGDKVRWLEAGDSVLAVGTIFNIYQDDTGKDWYQIEWDITEPKTDYTPATHTVPALVFDRGTDIRLLTPAEHILYMENKNE